LSPKIINDKIIKIDPLDGRMLAVSASQWNVFVKNWIERPVAAVQFGVDQCRPID
jgi:hypothetical protein